MCKLITNSMVQEIRDMRVSGMTLLDIAVDFGIDKSTVSRLCSDIPRPTAILNGRRRKFDYDRMVALKAKGLSYTTLALRLGVSRSGVLKAMKTVRASYALEAAE